MAPSYVALTAALMVGGATAFIAPSSMLRQNVAQSATRSASSSPMRMSLVEDEPWFSEAVAENVVSVDELK